MTHRLPRTAIALCLAASLGTPTLAHDYNLGPLHITHPWARATLGGAEVAGGYMTVETNGSEPDRLVSAASDVAARVEIHEMKTENGVMKMQALKDGLAVTPGAPTVFKPGSYHIMFIGLKGPLKEGGRFKATLAFEKAGKIEVDFAVESGGAKEPSAHKH